MLYSECERERERKKHIYFSQIFIITRLGYGFAYFIIIIIHIINQSVVVVYEKSWAYNLLCCYPFHSHFIYCWAQIYVGFRYSFFFFWYFVLKSHTERERESDGRFLWRRRSDVSFSRWIFLLIRTYTWEIT